MPKRSSPQRERKWFEWIDSFNHQTSLTEIWKRIKIATGSWKKKPHVHPHPKQMANRLAVNFRSRSSSNRDYHTKYCLLQEKDSYLRDIKEAAAIDSTTDRPFTLMELDRAIPVQSTSPGPDLLAYNTFRSLGKNARINLLNIYNASYRARKLPDSWKKTITLPIPKPGEDHTYRPITLISCISKIMEKMITNRLRWLVKPNPNTYGFTPKRSTQDALMDLFLKIGNRRANTIILFVDVEKAFEKIDGKAVSACLARRGVKSRLLMWIFDFLRNRSTQVKYQGVLSNLFHVENGTPQGSPLSPALFNIAIESVTSPYIHRDAHVINYADDIAVVINADQAMDVLEYTVSTMVTDLGKLGLTLSKAKTKVMAIKNVQDVTYPTLLIDEEEIKWTSQYKYLGVIIDDQLDGRANCQAIKNKVIKKLNSMKALSSRKIGLRASHLRRFYVAAVRSVIEYSHIFLTISSEPVLDRLGRLQNEALRIILGTPRWTKITVMQRASRIYPLQYIIHHRFLSNIAKVLSTLDNSTNKEIISRKLQGTSPCTNVIERRITEHVRTWIPELLNFKTASHSFELAPWEELPFTVKVNKPTTKKTETSSDVLRSCALEGMTSLEDSDLIFYTDGSVSPDTGRAGAGVVSFSRDGVQASANVRISDNSTIIQAELTAILTALYIARQLGYFSITIHTDSLSAIHLLQQRTETDHKLLLKHIKKLLYEFSEKGHVIINWVPSHVNIKGNELADKAAKDALENHTVFPLRRGSSSIKTTIHKKMNQKLEEIMNDQAADSVSTANILSILQDQENVIMDTLWDHKTGLTRAEEVAILRIITGYRIPLQIEDRNIPVICNRCGKVTNTPQIHAFSECVFFKNWITLNKLCPPNSSPNYIHAYVLNVHHLLKSGLVIFAKFVSNNELTFSSL